MPNQIATLRKGTVITHRDLVEIFEVGFSGGIRPSKKTKTIIVISNHVESIYDDKWIENVLHYTGTGKTGDQKIDSGTNKTLNEATSKGYAIHLFEVFEENQYLYQGVIEKFAEPYQETQPDKNWNLRKVWIFPFKLKDGISIVKEVDPILSSKKIATQLKHLSNEQIRDLVNKKKEEVASRKSITTSFIRDQNVVLYALKRANGKCELCENDAPFITKANIPFLEIHHITYLSREGSDTFDNVSALCPNCHRKMHQLENKSDIKKLEGKACKQI